MRFTYIPIFAVIWVVYWIADLIMNFQYYTSYESGRIKLIFSILMLSVGVLLFVAYFMIDRMPKALQKISPNKRCPNCYAKLKGNSFCPKCGEIVDKEYRGTLSRCATCGKEIDDPDRDFCPGCGSMLKK